MKMIAEDKVKLYVKRILETRENPVSTTAEILFKVGLLMWAAWTGHSFPPNRNRNHKMQVYEGL